MHPGAVDQLTGKVAKENIAKNPKQLQPDCCSGLLSADNRSEWWNLVTTTQLGGEGSSIAVKLSLRAVGTERGRTFLVAIRRTKKHRRESLLKPRSICNHKLQNTAAKQNESWIKLVANIKSEYTPRHGTANAAHLSWILVHFVLTRGCRLTSFHHEGLLCAIARRGKWSKSVTSSSHSRVSHVTSADMLWPKYMTISKELRGEIPTFVWME
nr:uncharacterized protein LOC105473720 [Macaca nemestrina]